MGNAIALTETKGRADCHAVKGGSLEVGCFQFQPATFDLYSKEILGHTIAFTALNEEYIAYKKIDRWLSQGETEYSIFLMWNTGAKKKIRGVNKYGVAYDSVAYAQEGMKNLSTQ